MAPSNSNFPATPFSIRLNTTARASPEQQQELKDVAVLTAIQICPRLQLALTTRLPRLSKGRSGLIQMQCLEKVGGMR